MESCGRSAEGTGVLLTDRLELVFGERRIRAVRGRNPIDPDSVQPYLDDKFGEDLEAVRSAMQKLAKTYNPQELAQDTHPL
jgi:hypothetical protein